MSKSPEAFRTISEVSEWLDTPTYVLRFWESRFSQIKPVKRAGGRRYYRPEDMMLLGGIKKLLHFDELTIKAVKQILKDKGVKHVMELSPDLGTPVVSPQSKADEAEKAEIAKMVKAGPVADPAPEPEDAPDEKPAVEVRVIKKGKVKAEEAAKPEDAVAAKEETATQDPADEAEAPAPTQDVEAQTDSAAEASEPEPAPKVDAPEAAEESATEGTEPEPALAVEESDAVPAEGATEQDSPADWENLTAAMIGRGPIRIKPAAAYDGATLGEIETLYYSLRIARNGIVRAKAEQEKAAG